MRSKKLLDSKKAKMFMVMVALFCLVLVGNVVASVLGAAHPVPESVQAILATALAAGFPTFLHAQGKIDTALAKNGPSDTE